MKRLIACLTAFMLLFGFQLSACPEEAQTQREVLYFYTNFCESCAPEDEFAEYFRSLTGVPLSKCNYSAYNTVKSSGQNALKEATERYGLTRTSTPMVIVDGIAYYGAGEMETALASDALAWSESTDSVIVLLTVPMCENRVRVSKTLESLPETVSVKRGNLEIESAVVLRIIDITEYPELASRLFDAYSVPEESRIAPSVFYADRYLSGADAIEKSLIAEVELGWAAGGVSALPAGEPENP